MIGIHPLQDRNCQGGSRRDFLRVGALTAAGLSLPDLLRARAAGAAEARATADVNCIFIFLWGGPSQHETFDPKPDAVTEVRGPFGAIPTSVDGLQFGEHLPRLARQAHRFATVRCLHHGNALHPQSGSYVQAGQMPIPGQAFPNHGSVVARFGAPARGVLPPFVRVGPELWDSAGVITAQDGGFLGGGYAPFAINDPQASLDKIATLNMPRGMTSGRVDRRRALLRQMDELQRCVESADTLTMDAAYERAFSLLTSPESKKALDLTQEPERVRERYGKTLPGQGMLMARRLVEAGVRFVQLNWSRVGTDNGWDTHGGSMGPGQAAMKEFLLPTLDQSLSALFDDLEQRGLSMNTLVVACGEFGRTARLNAKGGRDHWPGVYPALFHGYGVPPGLVVGKSDEDAAYPDGPHCTPDDVSMTIYRLMGLDVSNTLREARVVQVAQGIPGIGSG